MEKEDARLRIPLPQQDGWKLWKTICRNTDFDDLLEGNDSVGTDRWRDLAAEIGLNVGRAEAAASDLVGVGFAVNRDDGLFITDLGISIYHNVVRLGGAR